MAKRKKGDIKINKTHNGKEFSNEFRFIGLVKPVRKKDNDSDSWYDVPIYETTITQTKKDRRVLQFNVETAYMNELKVELAGMEMPKANIYSSTNGQNYKIDWDLRNDKAQYPDDTYHLITPDWDLTEEIGKWIQPNMWVDVRGSYEIGSFVNGEGEEIKTLKRIIKRVYPLKNGEVVVTGLKEGDTMRVYDSETGGIQLGYGKADDSGTASIKVGWLNPEGGTLFLTKVDGEIETKRSKLTYTDSTSQPSERIVIRNNITTDIAITGEDGKRKYIPYIRDFNDEDFTEINTFEMQIGIKSTYQDENTKNTKVNAVYLDYGKERSAPRDVELVVYYKEASEGKTPFADAFARLNRLDFMVVEGIDNNRAEFALVEVQETEDDNPFDDVEEKESSYERVSSGTKKGLEIVKYIGGTYKKQLLTEEEISSNATNEDPFKSVEINDDDLPF